MSSSDRRTRHHRLVVRLNEDELAALRWLVATQAATSSDVVRTLITRAATKEES